MPSELAELTAELCRIPSVTGHEQTLADDLERRLRAIGLDVGRVGRSLVARGPSRGRPLVTLLGHSDTVPPSDADAGVRFAGTRLHGLGASDMKGGLAVMLELARRLPLGELPVDLGLVFYDAEEGPIAGNGLGRVLAQVDWLAETSLGVCLEPSDNQVQVGCVGSLHSRLTFEGRAAHSARPWQGDNAVHKAGPFLAELYAREPVPVEVGGHVFHEVMSVTLATGGRARNVVPDAFQLNLNYRFAPGRDRAAAERQVRELVADRAGIEFVEFSPSGRVVQGNPLFERLVELTGAEVTAKQAWTDVAQLSEAGIDAVNFGPGNGGQAHQADEYIELHLLEESFSMFERFLAGA